MPTYLDRILAAHRAGAAADRRPVGELIAAAHAVTMPARGFAGALREGAGVSVIAEIKRRSPSKGTLAPDLDPPDLARSYRDGGAACLSVLTDAEFFGGSPGDVSQTRAAVALPVLRKDFTLRPADVCDTRLMGADALLLIAAALSPKELAELLALASTLDLDALVEVHEETEAETALALGATLIGVNQRDLVTFAVDPGRAERLAGILPDTVVRVAESGIRTGDDVARLGDAGYDAVLVGESLVTAVDPAAAVRSLVAGAGSGRRAARQAGVRAAASGHRA
ncbi:MAG: indole-3-glycerol phosphate synthase TrpC [Actinomycetota bacterium]|nr:indole-3-glycerol phosphate synthase TrpC [Actinomycetota bacterium]